MTRRQKGKKAAASFLAGILLCQMSVFGVSQTPVNARENIRKMNFEIIGEGTVTVTDVEDKEHHVKTGDTIEVPEGMCVRVQADAEEETAVSMHILDETGNYELEDATVLQTDSFWRDVTAMDVTKNVRITFGENKTYSRSRMAGNARGNQQKPEVGDVFTGNCVITKVDGGNGHTVHGVTMGGFTGILAGVTATGGCADHTAAAPYEGQEYTYTYTITSVNKSTGEVKGNLYCTSVTGATDGVTKDDNNRLIGYQRVNGSAVIYRSYSGYAKLKKAAEQTAVTEGNALYSLENAVYGVYRNANATEEAATFKTDREGNSNTVELEEGNYFVKEKSAPKGYKLDGTVYPVRVTSGKTVMVNVKDIPVYSDLDLTMEKIDLESEEGFPQGTGTLEGAEFTLRYYAGMYDRSTLPEEPDRTWVLGTKKENGHYVCKLDNNCRLSGDEFYCVDGKTVLPLGTISIEETKAPKGYLLESGYIKGEQKTEGTYYLTQITQDGSAAKVKGGNRYQIADRVIRGDIEFQKKDEETQESMEGIPFQITSVTTGESHRIMTDANGYFSSASDYAKHSLDTNSGQAECGVWFGTDSNGGNVEVNDSYGAFPYDTYRLEELRCDKNVGKALYKGTFQINREKYTIDLGTILNPDLMIATSAKDEKTGTHYANAAKDVTLVDTVTYTGLKKGQKYVMKGKLIDYSTGEPLLDQKGKAITSSETFVPKTAEGSVEVTFSFDGSHMEGKNLTVYEECCLENEVIAVHKDLEDKNQMIHFPKIRTSAQDEQTKENITKAEKDIVITDTVTYQNLKKGKRYQMKGTLMDKETGKAVKDAKGATVTAVTGFVAEETDGEVEVRFTFDGSGLGGKTLVAFEKLYDEEKLYAVHADLEDEKQTIHVPDLKTVAVCKTTGTHQAPADENIELTDTVEYHNLLPQRTYTLYGTVIEKETKKPLCEEKITEFVPEQADGTAGLEFTIDAKALAGKTAVVFEELKLDDRSVAEHKDPESEEQSVHFPKIGTKAMDEASKTQEGEAKEDQKITDEITYTNLLPGETYTVKGTLMNKEDGTELRNKNGKKLTAKATFIPEKENGTMELTFSLDATDLDGKSVVVFERIYDGKESLVAREENIENKDQTVSYKKTEMPKKTPSSPDHSGSSTIRKAPKTGVENYTFLWIFTITSLGIAVAAGMRIYRRKKDDEKIR